MVQPSNVPELSVSELSFALKRSLEDGFGRVRVRGELSKVKIHSSGHLYSDLKDADCLINLVCWRTSVARLAVRPEEGLEVICTGKITTYPARSNYQLVVEQMELAGQGALLKMLEDRRQKLLAEGLFHPDRKKKIPSLPYIIGVVTSPTGSVIRDIIHRIEDRFPSRVLVWPVPVQGEGAAGKIAAAIKGFCGLPDKLRPDVVIVARGGGSIEDLMPFNEEIVVRAAAACTIPLISAVGHETDTTLIDYAADLRAPTPTAAAEMAVPERLNLVARIENETQRLLYTLQSRLQTFRQDLRTQTARLGDPERLIALQEQRFDHLAERLPEAARNELRQKENDLIKVSARLLHPRQRLAQARQALDFQRQVLSRLRSRLGDNESRMLVQTGNRLVQALQKELQIKRNDLVSRESRLSPPRPLVNQAGQRLEFYQARLEQLRHRLLQPAQLRLQQTTTLLSALSYHGILKRGYAVIRDADGAIIRAKSQTVSGQRLTVEVESGEFKTIVE